MKTVRKIGLAIFKDKKLLMVRTTKGNVRFLGGKVDEGESDIDWLKEQNLID